VRFLIAVLAVCSLFALVPSRIAAQGFEAFGGYSYVYSRTPITSSACSGSSCLAASTSNGTNLSGFELAATGKVNSWFGITGDFSAHYGTSLGASDHLQTFLAGPKFSYPADISPFVHILVGGAHYSLGNSNSSDVVPTSQTAFAAALGGGIDAKLAPFIAFRVIQFDYLLTTFHSTNQNQPRVSTGIVIRF
jgi:hypothetical protein